MPLTRSYRHEGSEVPADEKLLSLVKQNMRIMTFQLWQLKGVKISHYFFYNFFTADWFTPEFYFIFSSIPDTRIQAADTLQGSVMAEKLNDRFSYLQTMIPSTMATAMRMTASTDSPTTTPAPSSATIIKRHVHNH